MNLQEYKNLLEKESKTPREQEILQTTKDSVWRMYLEENWTPKTALATEINGF